MTEYPIPVADWTGAQALTIVCERCAAEAVIDADEILNEGLYECPADTERGRRASTEQRCRGTAVMKYEVANKCANCGALGWDFPHEDACSRRCKLQAEYAASIERAEA